ncbi:hypothetical protein KUCAC02_016899 [Chaenocephalus aceratus]|nr:hypothetical protein KUCAC02_016899 [Chaenocephalus aceratus]
MERMESMEPISAHYTTDYPEIHPDSGFESRESCDIQANTPPPTTYDEELVHKNICVTVLPPALRERPTSQLSSVTMETASYPRTTNTLIIIILSNACLVRRFVSYVLKHMQHHVLSVMET